MRKLDYFVHFRQQSPVLIYQMGKVGSKSVLSSFPTVKYPIAVHLHRLHEGLIDEKIALLRSARRPILEHYYHGKAVYQRVIKRNQPFKMITLVREPISRNMSYFFQKFEELVGVRFSDSKHSIEELIDIFLANENELNRSMWFDNEFYPSLGINVYEHPFPKDVGHTRIQCGRGEILLLQLELDNGVKQRLIADFLEDPDFRLGSGNVGATREYSDVYQAFKSRIVLPESYVSRMLDSEYTRHFYSDEQIEAVRNRWMCRIARRSEAA